MIRSPHSYLDTICQYLTCGLYWLMKKVFKTSKIFFQKGIVPQDSKQNLFIKNYDENETSPDNVAQQVEIGNGSNCNWNRFFCNINQYFRIKWGLFDIDCFKLAQNWQKFKVGNTPRG